MPVDYRKEKIRVTIQETTEEKEHFHQDIELLYVLEGALSVTVGNVKSEMLPEDVLVINAEKEHYLTGSEDVLYMKLSIEYSMVSDILSRYDIIFWCDSSKSSDVSYDELRAQLKRLLGHYLSTRAGVQNFSHIAMCYQILDYICTHFLARAAVQNLTEKEKMLKQMLYDAAYDEELVRDRKHAKELCYDLNQLRPSDEEKRKHLVEKLLGEIHGNFEIIAPFYCDYGYNIEIGENFFANHNTVILDCAKVSFGDNVVIGGGSVVVKDIPSNSVAVGNPCRVIREIDRELFHEELL